MAGATGVRAAPLATTVRRCLTCGRAFKSEGPGNRLCKLHRHLDISPFDPDIGGLPDRTLVGS